MKILLWSKEARIDLEGIYEFHNMQNHISAVKIHNSILDAAERLRHSPMIGSVDCSGKSGNPNYVIRSIVVKGGLFKIFYYVKDNEVMIVRVWPCRKNPESFYLSY